ncbi:arsenite-resistance protein 2-domain-containing protein [Gongronella butleri]|nr:arsenite-resistance protein 2-domain-containing protein [Gongronella butleri]
MQLDYIVPFRQFSDYVRQKSGKQVSDDEVQRQFDEYKEKVSAKQLDAFFNNNKDKQWFLEKYHPEHAQGRINTVYEQRRIALERFRAALPDLDHEAIQLDYDANPDKDDHMHLYQQQQLIIKAVPPTIAREKIEEMCRQVAGFDYLALSDPSPSKKFQRIGWIHFSNDTDLQSAFDQLDNQKIDDFTFHLALHRNPPPSASSSAPSSSNTRMKKTAPEIANNPDRVATDLDQATALAHVMDAHLGIDDQQGIDAVLANAPSSNDDDTKKTLDLILLYLRRVHMYCYYCGLECDSFEELHRRCPEPHLRKQPLHADQPLPSKTERALQQWAKNLDQRIRIKLQPPDDEDLVRMGGKSVKAELDKYMAEHIQKEHDAKYKCKVGECAKAFKGVEFVEKHIHSKHPEVIKQMKNELAFYNNYVCDPNHLLPMQPPQNDRNAASSSSSSMASSMASSAAAAQAVAVAAAAHVASMPTMNTDQIPRIGFSSGPWATPPMPRIPSGKSMDMLMDMPQDPRQVKSYVDLDAPADGDSTILFY